MLSLLAVISLTFAPQVWPVLSKFESEGHKIQVQQIVSNRNVIWGMAFVSANEILFSERNGKLCIFNLETQSLRELKGVPEVAVAGQGGLLDVQRHPDFDTNRLIYFTYSVRDEAGASTRLARAKLGTDGLENLEILFTAQPFIRAYNHFGSRIAFDKNKYLFMSIGDRTKRDLAQDLSSHPGSLLRLDENGKAPKDNPFVGQKDAHPEIWSYGHRNAQGLSFHPESGELWLHEHGPRGGDELNLIKKSANYGWPRVTYGREYYGPKIGEGTEMPGVTDPVKQFTPSIAPSGLEIYSGKIFKNWKDSFLIGALAFTHLNRLEIEKAKVAKEERLLEGLKERIRDVLEGPDGLIYLSTDSGKILRLSPDTPAKLSE